MTRKRATNMRASSSALAGLLRQILSSGRSGPKTRLVNFLVSEAEFVEMRKTSKALGLTLSAYLRGLHRAAVEALRREPKAARKEPRGRGGSL